MPTYDYKCEACDHAFELYQSIKARPIRKCPECHQSSVIRLIGTGGGVIFKGSGFYQTDYRSSDYKKAAEAESKSTTTGGSDSKSGDDKKSSGTDGTSSSKPTATKKKNTDS